MLNVGKVALKVVECLDSPNAIRQVFCIALLARILLPGQSQAAEVAPCLKASLEVDAAMTTAKLRVAAERPPEFGSPDWKLSGVQQPGFFDYTLDIRRSVLPEGREYPLVVRMDPDRAAINLRQLSGPATKNADRICETVALTVAGGERNELQSTTFGGYAFFKNGLPTQVSSITSDDRIPHHFVDSYTDWFHRSRKFYRSALGGETREVNSVLFLVDQDEEGQQSGCRYAGSALPGLLLIGLRPGCLTGRQEPPGDLRHFVAHETFHQWNYTISGVERDPTAQAFRLMLLEGGAELAAVLFNAQTKAAGDDVTERYLGAAAKGCVDAALGRQQSIVELVNSNNEYAYSCGAVYAFLSMAPDGRKPLDALARFWKPVLVAPDKPIRSRVPFVDAAFTARISSLPTANELFSATGYQLVAAKELTKGERFQVAVELLREISRNDCQGSYGLFTGADEIVIDPNLTQCQHLRAGGKPLNVGGFDIYIAPLQARAAWLSACDAGGTVPVAYKDSDLEATSVACASKPKNMFTPLRLLRVPQRETLP